MQIFHFLSKSIHLHGKNCHFTFTAQNPSMSLSSFCVRFLSSNAADSFTFSYLINTYGYSPQSALSISKRVNLKNPEKPDLLLSYFSNLGFSKSHISQMIKKQPELLYRDVEKTISPKVEFFRSLGASKPDLVKIFTSHPWVLDCSLKNQLVPSFNFFKDFLQSHEKAMAAVKSYPSLLRPALKTRIKPNINTLKDVGVPEASICDLIKHHGASISTQPTKFKKITEQAKEMGFDPCKSLYISAVMTLVTVSKSSWDSKVGVYKTWGWSDEDVGLAFQKYPYCMAYSKDKIMAAMNFYVNKLGLDSSVIAHRPLLLGFSLKRRLVPRASVIQFLSSKGLITIDSHIVKVFEYTEDCFIKKCINCHEEANQLLKLYKEKLDLSKQDFMVYITYRYESAHPIPGKTGEKVQLIYNAELEVLAE